MADEGYIKFHLFHTDDMPLCHPGIEELIRVRNTLHALGLIGVLPDGIGFGNISLRDGSGFLISASATGGVIEAGPEHFSRVEDFDIATNTVWCRGPLPASSESMSHGAVYRASPGVQAVIHVHDARMWKMMLREGALSTPVQAEFGTPELAQAIMLCVAGKNEFSLVLAGHEDGVLVGADSLDAALALIMNLARKTDAFKEGRP